MDYFWNHQRLIRVHTTKWILINLADIVYCTTDENYIRLFMFNKQEHLLSFSLDKFELFIASAGFFRIHQKHLINLDYYDRMIKYTGLVCALLTTGRELEVSRRKRGPLKKFVSASRKAQCFAALKKRKKGL